MRPGAALLLVRQLCREAGSGEGPGSAGVPPLVEAPGSAPAPGASLSGDQATPALKWRSNERVVVELLSAG